MRRRNFIRALGLGAVALTVPAWLTDEILHSVQPEIIELIEWYEHAFDYGYGYSLSGMLRHDGRVYGFAVEWLHSDQRHRPSEQEIQKGKKIIAAEIMRATT